MIRPWFAAALAVAALVRLATYAEQGQRPLAPLPSSGLRVAPFFDGWYSNPDGTITFSFGYSNLNQKEVEIPLGPDNFIEPKQYDGRQPTTFYPGTAGGADGSGAPSDRRGRERGVFTVTVPAGFQDSVVWTLNVQGQSYKVPANAKSGAYQLRWPMAMGSVPPLLRFSSEGAAGRGPTGIDAPAMRTAVGMPLALSVWTTDDSVREADPVPIKQRGEARPAMNVNWFKHSGPGAIIFNPPKQPLQELNGTAATSATFSRPGEYVIRVRIDNFGRVDTSAGNQCCWTNGYVKVSVTQ